MSLYAKRLEKGRFVWPTPTDGVVGISASQLDYMLDGIDWRNPRHTSAPSRRHKRDICMRRRRRAVMHYLLPRNRLDELLPYLPWLWAPPTRTNSPNTRKATEHRLRLTISSRPCAGLVVDALEAAGDHRGKLGRRIPSAGRSNGFAAGTLGQLRPSRTTNSNDRGSRPVTP
jgi:hypothetical protein